MRRRRPGHGDGRRPSLRRSVPMSRQAAITVNRSREEVQRLWQDSAYRPQYIAAAEATVTFKDAPGDRGTEVHVDLQQEPPGGKLGEAVQKLVGSEPLAKVKDDLRRFKA